MTYQVGVIGLGYVGLPLAVAAGRHYPTVGFDINPLRIQELNEGIDRTNEVNKVNLDRSAFLSFSDHPDSLASVNFFVVTVPTPVDASKNPNLQPLSSACHTVGAALKSGDIVVFESTVYPGCTEEFCVPILEQTSGLNYNQDFFCGYSPERINPADKVHRLENILKVTSGSTSETALKVDAFYRSFIEAGTHLTSSIRVAEAAKVIENAQRDINIAFVNELAVIFHKMNINTQEVLEAANTKWNFLPFQPGLVGGHCIGVDPYYLTYKAKQLGHHPQVILAGRDINDQMGAHVAHRVIRLLAEKGALAQPLRCAILGFTFKENCPDVRNTRVVDIYRELSNYKFEVDVFDPYADATDVRQEYAIELMDEFNPEVYDAVVLAVAHSAYKDLDWLFIRKQVPVIFDVKNQLDRTLSDGSL